jgi:hypothetical protein
MLLQRCQLCCEQHQNLSDRSNGNITGGSGSSTSNRLRAELRAGRSGMTGVRSSAHVNV